MVYVEIFRGGDARSSVPSRFGKRRGATGGLGAKPPAAGDEGGLGVKPRAAYKFLRFSHKKTLILAQFFIEKGHAVSAVTISVVQD